MIDNEQPEQCRQGVRVFGSAVIRVAPDIATILVGVSRLEQQPEPAFAAARKAAQGVGAYLHRRGLQDFGSSRITLSQEFRYTNGEQRFVGYVSKIGFSVVLRNMDQVEETVSGLIGAGANELTSVTFQTSRLREVRADARRQAIAAAREKAELYCTAAGVVAGAVLAIEDANPEVVTGRNEGHVRREPVPDDTGEVKAMDPAAIAVGAAVHVLYAIEPRH
jgi:uncharacterized protein YggE